MRDFFFYIFYLFYFLVFILTLNRLWDFLILFLMHFFLGGIRETVLAVVAYILSWQCKLRRE